MNATTVIRCNLKIFREELPLDTLKRIIEYDENKKDQRIAAQLVCRSWQEVKGNIKKNICAR